MTSTKISRIVAFDFDGTLTRKDSLFEFIRFVFGTRRMLWGVLIQVPWLVLMKLHLYSNEKAKQRMLSHFFRGMPYDRFVALGKQFSERLHTIQRPEIVQLLLQYQEVGDMVVVVTASIVEWVLPFCQSLGVDCVLGTQLEVKDGVLTGTFCTPNCYGAEKVTRLLKVFPARQTYTLIAYGDSRGDKELLAFADESHWIR